MSNQQNALPIGTLGKAFPPSLIGTAAGQAGMGLGLAVGAVHDASTIDPSDIRVNLLTASQVEAVATLREEINLDLHYRLDLDFVSHEKKEMS